MEPRAGNAVTDKRIERDSDALCRSILSRENVEKKTGVAHIARALLHIMIKLSLYDFILLVTRFLSRLYVAISASLAEM